MITQRLAKRLAGNHRHLLIRNQQHEPILREISDLRWLLDYALPFAWNEVRYQIESRRRWSVRPWSVTCGPHTFTISGLHADSLMVQSFTRYGCYEPALVQKMLETVSPDDVFWDIGAGIGYYALFLSQILISPDRILCLEVDKTQVRQFRRNFSRYPVKPLLLTIPVSNRDGAGTITLDGLLQRAAAPTVIKIDIEGAEVNAIEGASKVIRAHRPKLFIEVHPRHIVRYAEDGIETLFGTLGQSYEDPVRAESLGAAKGAGGLGLAPSDNCGAYRRVPRDY